MRTKRKGTSKAVRRRRHRRIVIGVVSVTMFMAVFFGVRYVTHMSFWRIDLIEVKGADQVSQKEIRSYIKKETSGSYWWLIPRDGILVYPQDSLTTGLLQIFPRLKEVTMTEDGFSVLEVYVKEREPYAVWCAGDELASEEEVNNCYFLDREGFVFSQAPEFSGSVYLRLIDNSTSTAHRLEEGTEYRRLSFKTLAPFLDQLSSFGFELYSITSLRNQTVKIVLSDGRYLLVDQSDDLSQVFENLSLLFDHRNIDITVNDTGSFSYIDLRFGKRIFYKPTDTNTDTDTER